MEIHGTIHFKLILPHFPGFQQEPLPAPVCSHSPECDGCPYLGIVTILRSLREQGLVSGSEAKKIAARLRVQLGADIIISL